MPDFRLTAKLASTTPNRDTDLIALIPVSDGVVTYEAIRRVPVSAFGDIFGGAAALDGFVTPEQFGAIGDGVHDDAPALRAALETEKPVMLTQDLYCRSMVKLDRLNVTLLGFSHTVHFDFDNEMYDSQGNREYDSITFLNTRVEDDPNAPLQRVWDDTPYTLEQFHGVPNTREGEPGYASNYKLGYMSYKGNKPFVGKYADMMNPESTIVWYFEEHSLYIENVKFHFTKCRGRYGLKFARYCNSVVRNVECVAEDEEGTVGLIVQECYNVLLDGCYAEGWYANHTWDLSNQGYGIQIPGGDKITIINSGAWNNKCGMMIAGSRTIWATNVIVQNFRAGADISQEGDVRVGSDGIQTTYKWANGLSCHADCINLVVNNLQVDFPTNYKTGIVPFKLSCPEFAINNVTVNAPKGYVTIGTELNKLGFISNVMAPYCSLTIGNSAPFPKYNGETVFIENIYITNSHFYEIINGATTALLTLDNCQIETRIQDVNHLVMNGCTVYARWHSDWAKLLPINVVDDAMLTGCTIYANRSRGISKKQATIGGPENRIHMSNCHVLIPSWGRVFKEGQEQNNVSTLRIDNLHGIVFGDKEFSIWDEAELN